MGVKESDGVEIDITLPAAWEQLAEECAELSKAALKVARIMRGENPTPISFSDAMASAVEEYTDVRLCVDVVGIEEDWEQYDRKLDRWAERLGSR